MEKKEYTAAVEKEETACEGAGEVCGVKGKVREKMGRMEVVRKVKAYLEGLSEEEIKKEGKELYEEMREELGVEVLEYGLNAFSSLLKKERDRKGIKSKQAEKVNKSKEIREQVKSYLEGLSEEEIKKEGKELYEEMREEIGESVLEYGLRNFTVLLYKERERRGIESKRAEKVDTSKEVREKVRSYLEGLGEEEIKKEGKELYEEMREEIGESVLEYGLENFRALLHQERRRRGIESKQAEKVNKVKEIRKKVKSYLEGVGEEEMKKGGGELYKEMREAIGEEVLEYSLEGFSYLLQKERERRSIASKKSEKVNKSKEIRKKVKEYLEVLSEEEIKRRQRELYDRMKEVLGESVLEYGLKAFEGLLQRERKRRGLITECCKKPDILKILSLSEVSRRIYDLVKGGKDLEEAKKQAVQEWQEREKTSGETGGGLDKTNNY